MNQHAGHDGAMPSGPDAYRAQAFDPGHWHWAPGDGCTQPDTSAIPIEEGGRMYPGSMPGSG